MLDSIHIQHELCWTKWFSSFAYCQAEIGRVEFTDSIQWKKWRTTVMAASKCHRVQPSGYCWLFSIKHAQQHRQKQQSSAASTRNNKKNRSVHFPSCFCSIQVCYWLWKMAELISSIGFRTASESPKSPWNWPEIDINAAAFICHSIGERLNRSHFSNDDFKLEFDGRARWSRINQQICNETTKMSFSCC